MRFNVAYPILGAYLAVMLGFAVYALVHRPHRQQTKPCAGFACIEHAQVTHGIDRAYTSTFAGRKVSCAAKTWEQGPVVVCRFDG